MKHRFDKPGSKARFITELAVDQPCEKADESDPSLPWLAQWCQLQNQIPSTLRDSEDVRMQPSQCQLLLDENPLLFQATTPCDQALTLDMAQLNHETFPPSLYDLVFPTSTVLPSSAISSAISSAVSIPKPSMMTARYYDRYDRYDQFDNCGTGLDPLDLELMAVTNDLGLDDPLSSSFGYDPNFDNPLSPISDQFKHILSGGKGNLDQEPTLAQLNEVDEVDEPFLDNLEFDLPVLLPEEKSGMIPLRWDNDKTNAVQNVGVSGLTQDVLSSSFPSTTTIAKDLIAASNTISTPQLQIDRKTEVEGLVVDVKPKIDLLSTSSPAKKQSTLHDLLTQQRTPTTKSNVLPFGAESLPLTVVSPRLSSSAPTLPSVEQIWKISPIVKTESFTEEVPTSAASTSSISTNDVCSPKDDYDSNDEGFDSDPEDSDHYDEMSSDADSTVSDDYDTKRNRSLTSPSPKTNKKERFFWQYNVQAKGPKINRLSLSPCNTDPHTLNEITDPVFSPTCYVQGIKHSGKARRGDGNDLTPNPRKLYQIGLELRKLNKVINDLTPVSELPFNARPKSRKEKNKLASRACRLKKKAQHEANKLKLYGLEHEHRKLLTILKDARQLVAQHMEMPEQNSDGDQKLTNQLDNIMKNSSKTKIAGRTADFVNEVIDSITAGSKPLSVLENL